ncbi:MAG: HAD family hydrolase [Proteobacteria bacterium]|nr:HAD family hydrolase [Pseudomonadota bacterium]
MHTELINIQLVAFDLDDTLYPEIEFVKSGFNAVAMYLRNRFELKVDVYSTLWDLFFKGERRETFNKTLQILGLDYTEGLVKSLVQLYRTHAPGIALYPDARDILETLYGRMKLGLITDGYLEVQKNKVRALQVEAYFDRCIFTDEKGKEAWKPSPWGYQKMMGHFSLRGEQCVYVGDNRLKDFAGAKLLGWKTCHIMRNNGLYRDVKAEAGQAADYTFMSLGELKQLLLIRRPKHE